MKAEEWRDVERLTNQALLLAPAERAAFTAKIANAGVRAEVESLLAADSVEDEADVTAIIGEAAHVFLNEYHEGQQIGPYRIAARLGAGGMGVVYRAEDERLGRSVAIKFLAMDFPQSNSRDRLRREARAASALNHPNICTIHDVGEHNLSPYIVMEMIEGPTLAAKIKEGPLPLQVTLDIATQIAAAVAPAHDKGIIHRDLKPANIKIKADGTVKILDFGLAKLTREPFEVTRDGDAKTEEGTVMGTAAYMSPEQAEGKPLDARSDIFSFGALLYEMATGRRAFGGDSHVGTMAEVLTREPTPPTEFAPGIPSELETIILRCLRKDPAKRLQHMAEVKALLDGLKEESESGKLAKWRRPWWRSPWASAVLLPIVAGAAVLGLWSTRDDLMRAFTRGRDAHVIPLTTFAGSENYPSLSPDGNQVVFSWNGEKKDNWDLYVKLISGANVLRLTTDVADDLFPAWSPRGGQIAFLKSGGASGIYVTSPLGGPEQKVADFDAAQGAPCWSPGEEFLIVAKSYREDKPAPGGGALFRIPLHGGAPRPILSPPPNRWYQYPSFDKAGQSLAFASCEGPAYGRYCDIMRVDLDSSSAPRDTPRKIATVSATIQGLVWSADGRAIFYSAGNLSTGLYMWRVGANGRSDPQRLEMASTGALYPTVPASGGRLAFARWMDDQDIWRLEIGSAPKPFLVSSMLDASPRFSPDGRHIAFASGRGVDRIAIWLSRADGTGLVELTRGPENYHGSPRWSPDGSRIAFDARGQDGHWNLKVIQSSGGDARPLTSGSFTNTAPSWSADGNWIYFASDRTGRFEIWRAAHDGGDARQITHDGGYVAAESADGTTLYYTKTGDIRGGPLYARAAGGAETQVLERVTGRAFAVFEDGIYYLDLSGPEKYELRLYEFGTRRSRVLSAIDGDLGIGFSVSPDKKVFLFSRLASPGSDLMLIENIQ